uniref:Uncharacterized protein n=1 Tax=Cannabis sativa TaxID=3483 RepID=A0A803R7S9_CANSA
MQYMMHLYSYMALQVSNQFSYWYILYIVEYIYSWKVLIIILFINYIRFEQLIFFKRFRPPNRRKLKS